MLCNVVIVEYYQSQEHKNDKEMNYFFFSFDNKFYLCLFLLLYLSNIVFFNDAMINIAFNIKNLMRNLSVWFFQLVKKICFPMMYMFIYASDDTYTIQTIVKKKVLHFFNFPQRNSTHDYHDTYIFFIICILTVIFVWLAFILLL